jgi:hypothetical protein
MIIFGARMRMEFVLCILPPVDGKIETATGLKRCAASNKHSILPRKSFSRKGKIFEEG